MIRDHLGADWAFGIRGAIENVVRTSFPAEVRLWPLLQTFDFEGYKVGDTHFIILLRDKLSGIPSCKSIKLKPFSHNDHPSLPVKANNVRAWQEYLLSKFALRPEDAAMVLPIHDSGENNAAKDFDLFTSEEKLIWQQQLELTLERQKAIIQPESTTSPQAPSNITYNIHGSNPRININSTDSSINIVQEQVPEVFGKLLDALNATETNDARIMAIEQAVIEMEKNFGTTTFVEKYRVFMSVLADHIQILGPIVAPYLPLLSALVN